MCAGRGGGGGGGMGGVGEGVILRGHNLRSLFCHGIHKTFVQSA